jgi:hypothetical protein
MQIQNFRRVVMVLGVTIVLAACSRGPASPYTRIKDPPLLKGHLHTITVISSDAAIIEQLKTSGYVPMSFAANYPESTPVEAALWGVSEEDAGKAVELMAPRPELPNVRVLVTASAPFERVDDDSGTAAFYQNVLSADVPKWPLGDGLPKGVQVQSVTYQIDNIVAASKKLRENVVPVVINPALIVTPALGGHKILGIRAPDGTPVELIETSAQ